MTDILGSWTAPLELIRLQWDHVHVLYGEARGERISEILTPQIAGVLLDHLNLLLVRLIVP